MRDPGNEVGLFLVDVIHSRSQRPRSFWSAPRIATSGQVQHRKSTIHRLPVTLRMFRVKSDKSDWFWSQSIVFTKPFKTGMSLDMARNVVGHGQRSRFLVLTNRSAASGDENGRYFEVNKLNKHTLFIHTLFIGHAHATSFSSARTDSKTQQNVERMTFALPWCANIFVGCSVTPTFFRQITSFSDSPHYTKKPKKSVRGKF